MSSVAAAGFFLLSGCDKQPGGQVVAVVGKEEVTLKELRAEARTQPDSSGPEVEAANAAALKKLIDRNVLADYARSEGLDRDPDYVERRRQFDQTLLAALAIRKLAGAPATPSDAEVEAFVADNPTLFGGRQQLDLEEIRIPRPSDAGVVSKLTALQSLDAIAARLQAQGIAFERGKAVLDTAAVDAEIGKQIVSLPDGEVFDITREGSTYFAIITGRRPAAADREAWKAAASQLLQRQRSGTAIEAEVARLRTAARIQYDTAYKPKTASS
ncbi:hypothetical protein GCM10007973_00930 [Polymorphobacter multimanifer]|uniref:peptidylprolyl isomerase n=1 Tax=Polymorphobacter multimanifer TaxID=1070431 RepID=A0A841L654_9SPHN|nr:hypothetical protein [Polymorphobacter multimanifer]MBB6226443.1 EpsD family peptidyl-prolyl cis-trans isomerase [Polymorphobacter multimanifer]GGI67560.1 hypothetical protein GCM10007973_00930 [Polymorphobacter multimanifer]